MPEISELFEETLDPKLVGGISIHCYQSMPPKSQFIYDRKSYYAKDEDLIKIFEFNGKTPPITTT